MNNLGSSNTKIWYTQMEGYRQRVAGISRCNNPHKLINPKIDNVYSDEWFIGWDKANNDLKRWGKI